LDNLIRSNERSSSKWWAIHLNFGTKDLADLVAVVLVREAFGLVVLALVVLGLVVLGRSDPRPIRRQDHLTRRRQMAMSLGCRRCESFGDALIRLSRMFVELDSRKILQRQS
jgi:hypothetical protein